MQVREEGRLRRDLGKGRVDWWAQRGLCCHCHGVGEPPQGRRESGAHDAALFPQSMESQVEEWYREVGELQAQTAALPLEPASKELVGERQSAVGERLVRLLEPLQERRRLLLASKELHQVAHDLDDELVRPGAGSGEPGGTRSRAGQPGGGGGEAEGPWRVEGF